jgi:HEAT repeat protein
MRRQLRELLAAGDLQAVARLADHRTRVLGDLLPFTYDPDPRIAWRAVEATGVAGARMADRAPDAVREHLRRLYWLLSEESGGICWRAPEAMAEIVGRRPDLYGDYVPIILHLITEMAEEDLGHFRTGLLWAIGRLGEVAADEVADVLPALEAALDHPDAQVRGMAVWALAQVGRADLLDGHPDLLADEAPVDLYENGVFGPTSVGSLARRSVVRG